MPRVERDAQTRERLVWFRRRQRLRWMPKTRYPVGRRFVFGEAQGEKLLRIAVRQDSRILVVYRNQVRREAMRAVNVVD